MNAATIQGNFATLSRPNGCLHRIEMSQVARHLEARSLKQMGMLPVEMVGDTPSKKTGAPLLGCDDAVVRYENDADGSCKKAPGFSLYLQLLRIWSEFAVRFAELPTAARSIRIFEVDMSPA
jgi:hypothetical protein